MKRIIITLCVLFSMMPYCYGQENDADTVVYGTMDDTIFIEDDSLIVYINDVADTTDTSDTSAVSSFLQDFYVNETMPPSSTNHQGYWGMDDNAENSTEPTASYAPLSLPTSEKSDLTLIVDTTLYPDSPSIPYSFDVSPSGAYVYNVPIDVFPGINGMQPNLALVYNSQSGNTTVGYGWSLSGVSTIAQRPKNIYCDGKVEAVKNMYSDVKNYAWVLDGQKLIYVTQSTTGNIITGSTITAEYRTEMSSAIKIEAHYYRQFSSWFFNIKPIKAIVYYPDGKIAEYGINKQNLLMAITKVTDNNGNTIEYSYVDDKNALRIASIQYGANSKAGTSHFAKVEFTYRERTDKTTMYEAGQAFINNHLLNTIKVSYNNYTLRTYTLSYTNRYYSQLTGISLKSNSNNSDYNPLHFNYNTASGYTGIQETVSPKAGWETATNDNLNYFTCRYFEYGQKEAIISWLIKEPYKTGSNASGYGTASDDVIAISSPNYASIQAIPMEPHFRTVLSADIYGQDRDQLIKVNSWMAGDYAVIKFSIYNYASTTPTTKTFYRSDTYLNLPATHVLPQKLLIPHIYLAGDFNGDGKQELCLIQYLEMRQGSTQNGELPIYICDLRQSMLQKIEGAKIKCKRGDAIFVADYDGDGKQEIFHINGESGLMSVYSLDIEYDSWSLSSLKLVNQTATAYKTEFNHEALVGDINGDGKADILVHGRGRRFYPDNPLFCRQYTSTGSGFNGSTYTLQDANWILNMKMVLADFNTDGKSDLAVVNNGNLTIYYSDGERINTLKAHSLNCSALDGSKGIVASVDHTSHEVDRVVAYLYGETMIRLGFTANEQKSALLKSIRSIRSTINIEYDRWDKLGIIFKKYVANPVTRIYPYQDFNGPLWVTTYIYSSELQVYNKYLYGDPIIHKQGLGFRGFTEIDYRDIRGNWFYKQYNPVKYGIPVSEETPTTKTLYHYYTERMSDKSLTVRLDSAAQQDKLTGITTTTTYLYDSYGNPTNITKTYSDAISETAAITYINHTANGQWRIGLPAKKTVTKIKNTAKWSEETTFAYDTSYNPVTVTDFVYADNSSPKTTLTRQFTYDLFGQVSLTKEKAYNSPIWRQSRSVYSPQGLLLETEDDQQNVVLYAYNYRGLIPFKTSYNSLLGEPTIDHRTSYIYDDFQRITHISYNNNLSSKSIAYLRRGSGMPIQIITETGKPTIEIHKDKLGRTIYQRTRSFDNSWIAETTTYVSYGRLKYVSSPAGITTYSYDAYDRLLSVVLPTSSSITYAYNGLSVSETKNDQTVTTTRNAAGETVAISSSDGTIEYTLRPDGQPSSVKAGNVTTSFEYDEYGRQTKIMDPSAGIQEYVYDNSGRLWKQTNARNQTTTVTYDDYDRLVLRVSPEFATTYTYRPDGLLTNESSGSYALAYEYDTYNRLIRRTETVNAKTFPIEYQYSGPMLDTIRYPSLNYTVAYEHNPRGFITNVAGCSSNNVSATKAIHRTSPSDDRENEEAMEAGTTHTFTFGNNTSEIRRYNRYGMQTQFYLQSVSHIHKESYDYDIRKELLTDRNIYSTRRNMNGMLVVPSQITYHEYFQYDNLQRLTNYGRTNEGVENPQAVTYDTKGNILSKTHIGDYVYSSAKPYAVTEIVNIPDTNSFPATRQDIEYTSFMRPQHIIEGKYRVYFDYGTNHERCRMELYENDIKQFTRYYFAGGRYEETLYEECYTGRPPLDSTQSDSNNTSYVLTDSIKVVEFTPKLILNKDLVRLANTEFVIDTAVLTIKFPRDSIPTHRYYTDRIFYVDGSPYNATIAYTPDRQNKHYYIHRDRQGSVRRISDVTGVIVATYYYDPWGRQADIQGNTYAPYEEPLLLLGRGYTGHEHLPWFNLINMNARLYDPVVGRLLSPDPYVQAPDVLQNFNRYSYCLNNPLMYVDPDGENPLVIVAAIIGAVIGAYSGGVIANDGQYNPAKWDYGSGKTWGYMLGGAIVGGISGYVGGLIAGSGIPMANTAAIASSSLINSFGTWIYTGGQTPISISFGIASYDFTNNQWGYLGKKGNKWYENLGYGLGALANVSDIINLPFWSGKKETVNADGTITKEPHKVGLTTNNEDWISHAEVDINGNNVISWGPTETSYSKLEYLTNVNRGSNSYHSYYGDLDKTLSYLSVRANANIVNAYAKFLNNSKLPYNAIFSSCSTQASIGLNLAGAFNLGFIHPYLLHYNLMITPYLYNASHYLLTLKH